MNKSEFVAKLSAKLSALPEAEIEKSLAYYIELINDRMEDGQTEEEAVAALGNIDDIAREIMIDTPFQTFVKGKAEKAKNMLNNNNALWIILVIIAFPLWFPLLMGLFGLLIGIVATIIGLTVGVVAIIGSFGVTVVALLMVGIYACFSDPAVALFYIGGSLVMLALLLALIKPLSLAVKGMFKLCCHPFVAIKRLIFKVRASL